MLDRAGALLAEEELARAARADPNLVAPTTLFRMIRDLEPPGEDEGWSAIERRPFVRAHARAGSSVAASLRVVASEAGFARVAADPTPGPLLVFGWAPVQSPEAREALAQRLREATGRVVELAFCTHAAGPPRCWCRPPLPGLWIAFARKFSLDPRASALHPGSPQDRALGRKLGLMLRPGAEADP
jgi:hypothetical protein